MKLLVARADEDGFVRGCRFRGGIAPQRALTSCQRASDPDHPSLRTTKALGLTISVIATCQRRVEIEQMQRLITWFAQVLKLVQRRMLSVGASTAEIEGLTDQDWVGGSSLRRSTMR